LRNSYVQPLLGLDNQPPTFADVTEILSKKGELFDSFATALPDGYTEIMMEIAKTGAIKYEWNFLVRIFACKMIQVQSLKYGEIVQRRKYNPYNSFLSGLTAILLNKR
jgi:hypothetical protein